MSSNEPPEMHRFLEEIRNMPTINGDVVRQALVTRTRTEQDIHMLVDVLNEPDYDYLTSLIIEALVQLEDPRTIPALIPLLSSADSGRASAAAVALGEMRSVEAVEALTRALRYPPDRVIPLPVEHDYPFTSVRAQAAFALSKIADRRAVEPLIQALSDPDIEVRACVAQALGELADARALEPLIQTFSATVYDPEQDNLVHHAIVEALGGFNDPRACAMLANILDPGSGFDPMLRLFAARSLGQLGDSSAVEPLISALADPAEVVRTAAAEALRQRDDPRKDRPNE